MRLDQKFKLIDFDASATFVLDDGFHEENFLHEMMALRSPSKPNDDVSVPSVPSSPQKEQGYAGAKYSSLYLPPEMVYLNDAGEAMIKTFTRDPETGMPLIKEKLPYSLLKAHYSFDVWSLGVILYYLCVGATLFQGTVDDNIFSINGLVELANFDENDRYWSQMIEQVQDNKARNLVSLLLKRDPGDRLRTRRILTHPFITNAALTRQVVETNVFISYRVASDFKHAEAVYNKLTAAGITVWWDRKGLEVGEDWEEGFVEGLTSSTIFLCLMSQNALFDKNNSRQRIDLLEAGSYCDNVLLEWRIALELKEMGLLSKICPVLIGNCEDGTDAYDNYLHHSRPVLPDVVVSSIESKLRQHFQKQKLGLPYKTSMSVRELYATITKYQATFVEGSLDASLNEIQDKVQKMLAQVNNIKSQSSFRAAHDASAPDVNLQLQGNSRIRARPPKLEYGDKAMNKAGTLAVSANVQMKVDGADPDQFHLVIDDSETPQLADADPELSSVPLGVDILPTLEAVATAEELPPPRGRKGLFSGVAKFLALTLPETRDSNSLKARSQRASQSSGTKQISALLNNPRPKPYSPALISDVTSPERDPSRPGSTSSLFLPVLGSIIPQTDEENYDGEEQAKNL
jgi:hypothetical protein